MFDVGSTLMGALGAARDRLREDATATSRAQTSYGSTRTDAAMAGLAQSAIFTEAVLNAVHARLEELKTVSKG